ncbi:hypothetical protein [Pedobacter sp.]
MKAKLIMFSIGVLCALSVKAQTVEVSASESDAKIIVDGQSLGTGSL